MLSVRGWSSETDRYFLSLQRLLPRKINLTVPSDKFTIILFVHIILISSIVQLNSFTYNIMRIIINLKISPCPKTFLDFLDLLQIQLL